MLYCQTARGTIDDVVSRIEQAAGDHQFGVLGIHDLKQKLNDKGVDFQPACRVLEVCNPAKAKIVLESDLSIANALPCRIAVYEEDGAVKVSMLMPTRLLALFERPELAPVAEDVEQAMREIIAQACA